MMEGFSCPISDPGNDIIELAHGGGGLLMHRLIEHVIRPAFATSDDDFAHDGAMLDIAGARFAFTTDSRPSCARCSSLEATSARWRSTALSTIWRCAAPSRFT